MFDKDVNMDKPFPSPGREARLQPRSSMFVAAVLQAGGEHAPVKVRNMSANGAMIDSPMVPPPGTNAHLIRGALRAHGTVVWSRNNKCGLHFSSELSVREWLAPPSNVEQQRIDDIVALVKSGASVPPTLGVTPEPAFLPRSDTPLVDDLETVIKLMDDLESELISSEETVARHGMKLQNLDIAMQMVRAIAREIAPAGSGDTSSLAKLKDLRVACAQALGT